MNGRFGGEVVNVDDYVHDYLSRAAQRTYQRDEEPTVAQAVVACTVIGALGWALIWKIIRVWRKS